MLRMPNYHLLYFQTDKKNVIDEKIFVMVDESFSKKDDDVADILNISPVTVRTRRTKLKTKLV